MVDSLYDQWIDLALLLTGYYPVVSVRLTRLGTAIRLFQNVILQLIQRF